MSKVFENLESPASYEADIDEGWRDISEEGEDPVVGIFKLLQTVYWDAVRDEMANAILAFDDYKTFMPEGLPELDEESLESEYLRELLDLWDPLGLSGEAKDELCKAIFHNVKVRQKMSQDHIVASALLQACGFTDYDYVQEHRKPTFPSLGPAPQVDTKAEAIYEAVQCSECRFCIRSFHFYECKSGCRDCTINRNHIKTDPKKSTDSFGHLYLDSLFPVPFRLCCSCLEKSSHPRSHLQVVWRFKKAGDKGNQDFSRELDALEDHIKGQGLLSFGNAFLDYLSRSGRRLSAMSSRHHFPAGNAHCALMFGPLLIENGVTIHPGGALISTRSLPCLGRNSPQEVKEYLNPDYFKTINGYDVFCVKLHSVSPNRHIYEATKTSKPRRYLCSRKQVSGGLFTNYNTDIKWRIGEEKITRMFVVFAHEWRKLKSLLGPEKRNRELLKDCATYLTEAMHVFFSEDIKLHLFLLAQKLGKTQKLAYSRMSNNCQDFCNGILIYEKFLYPTLEVIYPFIPVSLTAEVKKESDDHCLSYLQSFARPLQYPIVGSQSRRAMVGSAVTMYSSFAQNDADLIDHVWSVRFGYDRTNDFSLGFKTGSRIGRDLYLLKDEEMSCSDRFAAEFLPGCEHRGPCTLADHLLDCPVDNLSILQTHIHRQQKYYYNEEGEFITNLGPKDWITNRLEILRRLKLLHDFLAEIANLFQGCCGEALPSVFDVKTLRQFWQPPGTIFARAWHLDKRKDDSLYFAPDIDFGDGEMSNWKAVGFFTLGTTLFETHRQLMYSRELFTTRLKTLKSLIGARLAGKEDTWSPWEWCNCSHCMVYRLRYICTRLDWNYISATGGDDQETAVNPGSPDYISPRELEKVLGNKDCHTAVIEHGKYELEMQEERYQSLGSRWETTYLLSLRLIFGTDTTQQIQDRLGYYRIIFEGKETGKRK